MVAVMCLGESFGEFPMYCSKTALTSSVRMSPSETEGRKSERGKESGKTEYFISCNVCRPDYPGTGLIPTCHASQFLWNNNAIIQTESLRQEAGRQTDRRPERHSTGRLRQTLRLKNRHKLRLKNRQKLRLKDRQKLRLKDRRKLRPPRLKKEGKKGRPERPTQTGTETDWQTDRLEDKHAGRQADRQIDTDRRQPTDTYQSRLTDRQTDTMEEIKTDINKNIDEQKDRKTWWKTDR